MKYVAVIVLMSLIAIAPKPSSACSVGGTYGFTAFGQGTSNNKKPTGFIAIAGQWTFSEGMPRIGLPGSPTGGGFEGTVNRIFSLSDGVDPPATVGSGAQGTSGTYSINSATCSGTVTFTGTPTANNTETYAIYATSANTIYWVNTTPGIVLTARMDRQ